MFNKVLISLAVSSFVMAPVSKLTYLIISFYIKLALKSMY